MDHHRLDTRHLLATNQQGSQEQHLLSLDELIDDDSDDVAAGVKDFPLERLCCVSYSDRLR